MIMSVTATGYVLAAERPPRQQSNWTQLTLIVGQQHTRAARSSPVLIAPEHHAYMRNTGQFSFSKQKTHEVSLQIRKSHTLSIL